MKIVLSKRARDVMTAVTITVMTVGVTLVDAYAIHETGWDIFMLVSGKAFVAGGLLYAPKPTYIEMIPRLLVDGLTLCFITGSCLSVPILGIITLALRLIGVTFSNR